MSIATPQGAEITKAEERHPDLDAATVEKVLLHGDLSTLTPAQRLHYYQAVCRSLGLNPLTKPFDYITLNGRLTLYAKRDAADQLRANRGISVDITSREQMGELFVVTARATKDDGRRDESIGAVNVKGLSGEALANAMMKAETKAKRRVTLSIAGLGWLDETEATSVPDAKPVVVDTATGEIVDAPPPSTAASSPVATHEDALWALRAVLRRANKTERYAHSVARGLFGKSLDGLTPAEIGDLADEIEANATSEAASR